ncbi:MAG: trypsin-like peptidase domain-containing protein [Tenericutes bacterium]|nr:trypsin-like peptidase domain-containing protein [Mycoplasmatota bacterium]
MKKKKYKKKKDKFLGGYVFNLLLIGFALIVLTIIGNYLSYVVIPEMTDDNNPPQEISTVLENTEAILLASKAKAIEANVYIQTNYGTQAEIGSGAIIDEDESYYYAITNAHVLDGNGYVIDSQIVSTSDGVATAFEVIKISEDKDLAYIKFTKLDREELIPLNLGSIVIRIDNLILAVGNPYGNISAVSIGSIQRVTYLQELKLTRTVIEHDAVLSNGSSGGALLDLYGNIIGINTWELEGKYYAIPLSVINTFLEN